MSLPPVEPDDSGGCSGRVTVCFVQDRAWLIDLTKLYFGTQSENKRHENIPTNRSGPLVLFLLLCRASDPREYMGKRVRGCLDGEGGRTGVHWGRVLCRRDAGCGCREVVLKECGRVNTPSPKKITAASSRPASPLVSRGFRRGALVVENKGDTTEGRLSPSGCQSFFPRNATSGWRGRGGVDSWLSNFRSANWRVRDCRVC